MYIKSFILGEEPSVPVSAGNGRNRVRISSPLYGRNCALEKAGNQESLVLLLFNVEKGLRKTSTTQHLKTSTTKHLKTSTEKGPSRPPEQNE